MFNTRVIEKIKRIGKVRVLFLAHDSGIGGAQSSFLDFLKRIDRDYFEPLVILPGGGAIETTLKELKITYIVVWSRLWIPSPSKRNMAYLIRLMWELPGSLRQIFVFSRKYKPDLVYTNTIVKIEGALVALFLGVPHVWHVREWLLGNRQIAAFLPAGVVRLIISTLSTHIVVNSRYMLSYFRDVAKDKISFVYNGFDVEGANIVSLRGGELKESFGLPKNTKIVGIIGTLHSGKGQDLFIEAASLVKKTFDNVTFLIVGGGDFVVYNKKLARLVENNNLREDVYFLGWRRDVGRIYSLLDVLVSASNVEPFGRVVMEGMAYGIPVVSTKSGGPQEIILDGITGILVDERSSVALAEGIISLLSDVGRAKEMGARGKVRVRDVFGIDKYVKNLEDVLFSTYDNYHG